MAKEEKTLLFKDLSSRAPYGVKVKTSSGAWEVIGTYKSFYGGNVYERVLTKCDEEGRHNDYPIEAVKPYLRPMSSMTEEEIKIYQSLQDIACSYHYEFGDIVDDFLYFDNDVSLDYLNSIHIDYRGLIPMGLAIEAPEGMYETE